MVWNFDLPEMPAGPVMELHGSRKRFHVPQGLKPLLEEMSLEVLREQPDNIYDFLAEYLRRKVKGDTLEDVEDSEAEEETAMPLKDDSDKKTYLTEDGVIVSMDEYGILVDISGNAVAPEIKIFTKSGTEVQRDDLKEKIEEVEDAHKYATVIQAAFRGHMVRKVKDVEKDKEAEETFTTEDGITVTKTPSGSLVDPDGTPVAPGTILTSSDGKPAIVNSAGKLIVQNTEEKPKEEPKESKDTMDDSDDEEDQQADEWQTSEEEWSNANNMEDSTGPPTTAVEIPELASEKDVPATNEPEKVESKETKEPEGAGSMKFEQPLENANE